MGGRFEDKCFAAESQAGRNMRAEQVEKIAASVRQACGPSASSVIAGDFNVMLKGYSTGSAFREAAQKYYEVELKAVSLEMLDKKPKENMKNSFDDVYIPSQIKVHSILQRKLGYVSAYGQPDTKQEMKTNSYTGCIDWIYTRNLKSLQDERVVSTCMADDLSDHNPVIVTLQWT